MRAPVPTPARAATTLLLCTLLVVGCSGSDSGDDGSPGGVEAPGSDDPTGVTSGGDDGSSGGIETPGADDPTGATSGGEVGSSGDVEAPGSEDPTGTTTSGGDDGSTDGVETPGPDDPTGTTSGGDETPPTVEDPPNPGPAVPDPMTPNSTRVDFDIEVPAYRSSSLLVRIAWGERTIAADWVGDELWSASADFPTDTEHRLTVTFLDRNGEVTLGTFEEAFRTGTNAAESYRITADRFDTERWDDDGDGTSNLDESIAGTYGDEPSRVLLFSETRGFRHDSIEAALTALEELAASADIGTARADDSAGAFTDEGLAGYDAVVWVLTSGDVLDADEQAAFERYIRSGGGYAGIHAASDTEYEWPWYGDLVGAYFERHPAVQSATQIVEDGAHPSTAHLGPTWTRIDEWYDFRSNPRARVNVLLRLDEGSYSGGGMGDDHPSAWYHVHDGGRSWYTGGGHTASSYSEPDFRAHLLGGLRYAVGDGN